jgi:hypothetical protein
VEPITAVAAIAAKHGIRKLVDALTGNQGIGDLAAELFESQLASEDRLDRRLAAIEHRFDDVLEQPYTTAVRTGLRTLSDANTATTAQAREDEFMRARDLFREASAAARSALQVAVAERYVVLCALALGRPDAAGNALRRLERNALTALLAARARSGFPARHAVAQLQAGQELGPAAKPGKLSARIRELVPPIQEADVAVNRIAGRLLQEAAVFAEGLGIAPAPELRWVAPLAHPDSPDPAARTLLDIGHWEVRPTGPGPIRVGPLSVEWHQALPQEVLPWSPWTADTGYRAALFTAGAGGSHSSGSTPSVRLDVGVTVRVDPALSWSPGVILNGGYTSEEFLGETEARLTCSLWPEWSFTTLEVDDVLTFPFGTGPDLT